MHEIITNSQEQTLKVGERIGELLSEGDIVCLSGDLGVGKTIFVKGIAKGLNIEEYITSPTFTIVNQHDGKHTLYHFDVYRINDTDELYEIGFEEYIYSEGISVIEWAELIDSILPDQKLWIKIYKDIDMGEDYRRIILEPYGGKYEDIAAKYGRGR